MSKANDLAWPIPINLEQVSNCSAARRLKPAPVQDYLFRTCPAMVAFVCST